MVPEVLDEFTDHFVVIVPAAGVGKRMLSKCPKQYLTINNTSILSHTVLCLLEHPRINKVVLALAENDQYFAESKLAGNKDIIRVNGGKDRVDSVLNALSIIDKLTSPWILVHDAARPCVTHSDIDNLIAQCLLNNCGGLLATPVRDTMKRGTYVSQDYLQVKTSIDREQLWHALTPQMYRTQELITAITKGQSLGFSITDESSAIELSGLPSLLVEGSSENIKITHPSDLALAEFYLNKKQCRKNKHPR